MWGKIYVGDITIAGLCPYCLCPICGFNSNQTMSPMIKFQFISRQVVMIFILRVLHVLCGEFSAFLGSPTNVHFLLNGQKKVNRKHALRQSRREKPSALLYRQITKPQHLWLDCYFFFVSSNKEKVTKKACPEQDQGKPFTLSF